MAIRNDGDQVLDSLRLSDKEHADIVSRMNRNEALRGVGEEDGRGEQRMPYSPAGGLRMKLLSEMGTPKSYLVRPRNISPHGMSVLHGVFIYNGSACQLHLTTTDNESVYVMGKVVFCQHIQGKIHEVGIRFDKPIDVSMFVDLGGTSSESESEETGDKLHGTVLYVEDSVIDRELLNYRLKELGVWMLAAENGDDAVKQLKNNPQLDLVIMDIWLPGETGFEILQRMRENGYTGPIVMVSADDTEENRNMAQEVGCPEFLEKPFKVPQLMAMLSKYLGSGEGEAADGDVLLSDFWSDTSMRPLIIKFLNQLDDGVNQLVEAIDNSNLALAQQVCQSIKGSAGNYGFDSISNVAGQLRAAITDSGADDSLDAVLDELGELRSRACKVLSEAPE